MDAANIDERSRNDSTNTYASLYACAAKRGGVPETHLVEGGAREREIIKGEVPDWGLINFSAFRADENISSSLHDVGRAETARKAFSSS